LAAAFTVTKEDAIYSHPNIPVLIRIEKSNVSPIVAAFWALSVAVLAVSGEAASFAEPPLR